MTRCLIKYKVPWLLMMVSYLINLYTRFEFIQYKLYILCFYIIKMMFGLMTVLEKFFLGTLIRITSLKASLTVDWSFYRETTCMERVLCVGGVLSLHQGSFNHHWPFAIKESQPAKGRYLHCKDIWRLPPPDHQFTLTKPVSRHQRSHARSVGGKKWWLCVHLCITSGLACGEVNGTSPGPAAWTGVEKCWMIKLPISAQLL